MDVEEKWTSPREVTEETPCGHQGATTEMQIGHLSDGTGVSLMYRLDMQTEEKPLVPVAVEMWLVPLVMVWRVHLVEEVVEMLVASLTEETGEMRTVHLVLLIGEILMEHLRVGIAEKWPVLIVEIMKAHPITGTGDESQLIPLTEGRLTDPLPWGPERNKSKWSTRAMATGEEVQTATRTWTGEAGHLLPTLSGRAERRREHGSRRLPPLPQTMAITRNTWVTGTAMR